MGEVEWSTVERKVKMQEKKKRAKDRKMKKREEVLKRAQNMIGLGPMNMRDYEETYGGE